MDGIRPVTVRERQATTTNRSLPAPPTMRATLSDWTSPDAVAFGAKAVENGMAVHSAAVDPVIVASRVGVDPTLTAHTFLELSRCRNAHRIAAARLAGGAELKIALR